MFLLLMEDRRIVVAEAKNVEGGEIGEGKIETQNGKNVLSRSEGFLKLSKVVRK